MPSKYPHCHFHTGHDLYTWLTEHQRPDESLSQTARRLLIERMTSTTTEERKDNGNQGTDHGRVARSGEPTRIRP
jgi:hypothetical protein